jgi:hypothetical protein
MRCHRKAPAFRDRRIMGTRFHCTTIVKRCEVAFLYDRGCVPSYTVAMIEFDEPPWDRFPRQAMGPVHLPRLRPDARHAR